MINYDYGIAGFIIPSISVIFGSIGCIISFLVTGIILYHLYYHHLKRDEKVTLLLSFNIYFCMLIYASTLVSFNIQNLIGNGNENSLDLSWCIFDAYLSNVAGGAMFQSFIIQVNIVICFFQKSFLSLSLDFSRRSFVLVVLYTQIIDGLSNIGFML
jgi:hypothetical protein